MALLSPFESVGDRREQWRRLERHWRDSLEEANRNSRSLALTREISSQGHVEEALSNFRSSDASHGAETLSNVVEKLSPAFESLSPFAKAIAAASQYEEVSGLVWSGLLSIIEASGGTSRTVPAKVVNLVVELCESIPILALADPTFYQLQGVQYAFQDLFEDFMGYCTQTCSYFSWPSHEPMLANVFARGPRGMLDVAIARINRHVSKLREAVTRGTEQIQAQRASEIAQKVPIGISDMPQESSKSLNGSSSAEFPVSTVYGTRNGAFVGREDVIEDIHDKVNKSAGSRSTSRNKTQGSTERYPSSATDSSNRHMETSPAVCVLHGLGGVGKTQIAQEYYYEHRGHYDAAFWMEAEHDWTLTSSFARIADKLHLLEKKTTDEGGHEFQSKAIEAGRNWLEKTDHRWLCIFDNVEDFGDLGRYLPVECRCNGTIIITTQSPTVPAWMGGAPNIIPVKAFDQDTAAWCLFKYLDRDPVDDKELELACHLAEHVSCLPLAMATIGGYVKQSQMSLEEFFENIKHKATLWEKAPKVQDTQKYEKSLITVFEKAFEDLKPAARELLNILAFLDPDEVLEEIFTTAIKKGLFNNIKNRDDLLDCYFELRTRQLIRRDTSSENSYISIHRVVQWNILLDLSSDYEHRWGCFKEAFEIIKAMLPKPDPKMIPEADVWPPYARYGRQILELRTHCLWPEPPVELPLSFAHILAEMGTYMWFSGKFPEGEKALETAESVLDENNTKWNDGLRAQIYAILGIITSFEGVSERERSMELRKRAYSAHQHGEIGKKSVGERTRDEDMIYWNMHSDTAFGYIQEEDFDATKKYIKECLEQYQAWEPVEENLPYEYAKYYQLMSFCHMADQDPVKAIDAISKCLALMQKAAGNDHPMAQLIKFCHANLLWHSKSVGMREEALNINKAVLEFRRKILGEFSHFTLESYSTCGKLCFDADELVLANEYLTACLQRRKRAVWNPEGVARAKFRHARVLRALANQERSGKGRDGPGAIEGNSKALEDQAEKLESEVSEVIQKYRREYAGYLPPSEDEEQNLDQMVSIWAGRFTGGLVQREIELPILESKEVG